MYFTYILSARGTEKLRREERDRPVAPASPESADLSEHSHGTQRFGALFYFLRLGH